MNISQVIGWKFNHQAGMRCKEIDSVMTIIEFPGGIPSQADQDLWTQEYNDWILAGGDKDAKAQELMTNPIISAILEELELMPGGVGLTARIQAKLKAKL